MKTFLLHAILFGSIGFCGLNLSAAEKQAAPSLPSSANDFLNIEKLVWRHFESRENFRPTDLIVREDVEALPKQFAAAGLVLKRPDDLLKRLLSKSDFLYGELYSPAGRQFMQRIAVCPDGYDRLDRLSRLPRGRQTVHDLIQGPGGEKMIEYMTTATGGKELGKMLSQDPNGGNFNAPTGRLYTVNDLLDYLKEQYEARQKSGKTPAKP
jgi:hypothetical protein